MASGTGDRDGVKLKVPETPDDLMSRIAGATRPARCALWKTGPLRFEKSGTGERQPPGFGNFYRFHEKKNNRKRRNRKGFNPNGAAARIINWMPCFKRHVKIDILIRAWIAHDKNKLHIHSLCLSVLVAELLPIIQILDRIKIFQGLNLIPQM